MRLLNILVAFDRFKGDTTLSDRDLQDYHSRYLDIYQHMEHPKQNETDLEDTSSVST